MSQATPNTVVSSRRRNRVLLSIAVIGIATLFAISVALSQFRVARKYAVHSYVASVCNAVQVYYQEHGRYPQSLTEIDTSMLDYDLGIPLQNLDYDLIENGYRVSYKMSSGQVIACP